MSLQEMLTELKFAKSTISEIDNLVHKTDLICFACHRFIFSIDTFKIAKGKRVGCFIDNIGGKWNIRTY